MYISGVSSIGLVLEHAIFIVKHASGHFDEMFFDISIQSHFLKGMYSTFGQRQVDGTTRGNCVTSHIGSGFEDRH